MPLDKSASIKTWVDDFMKSDNPKFKGKSGKKRQQMAIAAYYSMHESADTLSEDELLELADKESDYTISILRGIHTVSPADRKKHLKYLKGVLHPDDYSHIKNTLGANPDGGHVKVQEEIETGEELYEALRSQKTYNATQAYVANRADNSFHSNASHILHHGFSSTDREMDDNARHAVLFDKRLTDKHLDDLSNHIANTGKTTDKLDKNFHKNVQSVGILRAALKNDSPDILKDAKKGITADHKNAIFSHGTTEEQGFLLKHGLVNKSHLKTALNGNHEGLKNLAKQHLQKLKDSGKTTHEDLFHHLNPPDVQKKETFLDKAKNAFKQHFADRMQKKAPKERIEPTFEALIDSIMSNNLFIAKGVLDDLLAEKVNATLDTMKQDMQDTK